MCRKQSGIAIGRLCDKCDGKCPVCDSYVRPTTLVRICDECSFGNYQNKCVVCGGEGISDAFYCFECTRLEKDRDGCPKIINLGSSRTDVSFSRVPSSPFCSVVWINADVVSRSYSTKRKRIGRKIINQKVAWVGPSVLIVFQDHMRNNFGGYQYRPTYWRAKTAFGVLARVWIIFQSATLVGDTCGIINWQIICPLFMKTQRRITPAAEASLKSVPESSD